MLANPELQKTTAQEATGLPFSSCPSKGAPPTPCTLNTEVFWLYCKNKKIKNTLLICISLNSGIKKSSASPDRSYGHLELMPTNAARLSVQTL